MFEIYLLMRRPYPRTLILEMVLNTLIKVNTYTIRTLPRYSKALARALSLEGEKLDKSYKNIARYFSVKRYGSYPLNINEILKTKET